MWSEQSRHPPIIEALQKAGDKNDLLGHTLNSRERSPHYVLGVIAELTKVKGISHPALVCLFWKAKIFEHYVSDSDHVTFL